MSEFIDREKAIANIKAAYCCGCENYNGVRCLACQIMDAMDVLEDAPAVVPDAQRWRNPETDPPKVETEVLVVVDCGKGYCITTAFYEDGTVSQYESLWQWEDVDDYGIYDEEDDLYRLPKGWWEYRHFTPEDTLECPIDKPVVGWMPLPEKLKKEGVA